MNNAEKLLRVLKEFTKGEYCASDLMYSLNTQWTITHDYIRHLRKAGLIYRTRNEGQRQFFTFGIDIPDAPLKLVDEKQKRLQRKLSRIKTDERKEQKIKQKVRKFNVQKTSGGLIHKLDG